MLTQLFVASGLCAVALLSPSTAGSSATTPEVLVLVAVDCSGCACTESHGNPPVFDNDLGGGANCNDPSLIISSVELFDGECMPNEGGACVMSEACQATVKATLQFPAPRHNRSCLVSDQIGAALAQLLPAGLFHWEPSR